VVLNKFNNYTERTTNRPGLRLLITIFSGGKIFW
jgi:hypothetical protein